VPVRPKDRSFVRTNRAKNTTHAVNYIRHSSRHSPNLGALLCEVSDHPVPHELCVMRYPERQYQAESGSAGSFLAEQQTQIMPEQATVGYERTASTLASEMELKNVFQSVPQNSESYPGFDNDTSCVLSDYGDIPQEISRSKGLSAFSLPLSARANIHPGEMCQVFFARSTSDPI